jgi:hypothetical protein
MSCAARDHGRIHPTRAAAAGAAGGFERRGREAGGPKAESYHPSLHAANRVRLRDRACPLIACMFAPRVGSLSAACPRPSCRRETQSSPVHFHLLLQPALRLLSRPPLPGSPSEFCCTTAHPRARVSCRAVAARRRVQSPRPLPLPVAAPAVLARARIRREQLPWLSRDSAV